MWKRLHCCNFGLLFDGRIDNRMYKTLLVILFFSISFMSCMDKEQVLTKADMKARVDSIVSMKMVDIQRMAKEDLDFRSAIEVKVKADSIVQANQKRAGADTLKRAK